MRVPLLSALAVLACSLSMSATTITFTSSGSFSNPTGCNSLYPCSVTSSGGTDNRLNMSGTSVSGPSTLTAVSVSKSVSFTGPTTNVILGELDWVNQATYFTDTNFNDVYTFNLLFSAPNASGDSQQFSINIQQPTNPPGDEVFDLTNSTLSNLGPFTLNGVTMSNLHFSLATGAGLAGAYNKTTGEWTDPENSKSELLIEADFAPAPTPEPSGLALLGTGMLGIAGVIRRKIRASQE